MPPKKPSSRKTDDAPAKPAVKRTARTKVAGKAAVAIGPLALLDRAAKGEFPGTVYIEGPDEAVKAALLTEWRRLWAAAVPDAPLARVLNADEAGVDAILAAYQNVSLFAPRELTLVLELEKLGRSEKRVDALASGLSSPAGASCLVLVEPAAETPRKTLEPVRAACLVRVDVQPPSEQELLEWGRRRLAASGNTPEAGALEALLVELCLRRTGREHGGEFGLVELHQQRAARDGLAFVEADLGDAPGDLGADGHRLVGAQRADRADIVGRRRRARGRGLDLRGRRRALGGVLLGGRLRQGGAGKEREEEGYPHDQTADIT